MAYRIFRNGIDELPADVTSFTAEDSGDFREYLSGSLKAAQANSYENIALTIADNISVSEALSAVKDESQNTDIGIILIAEDGHFTDLPENIAFGIDDFLMDRFEDMIADECLQETDGEPEEPIDKKPSKKQGHSIPFLGKSAKAFRASEPCESAARYDKPDDDLQVSNFAVMGLAPMAAMSCAAPAMSLAERVSHISDTWQELLLNLIDEKGYTDTEVYKKANIDRKLFSKIRSNPAYQPRKITAVAFALALELNLDETRDFIARAGYAFSPSSVFDLIIEYFITNNVYDIYQINLAVFEHNQPTIGG